MKDWWKILFGLLCGLLAVGVILLVARPPTGEAVKLLPLPTPPPLLIHVAGAVAQPGVYTLPAGSRVQDAVQIAGGLLPDADLRAVNLAAGLQDGERILVPTIPPTPLPGVLETPGANTRLVTPAIQYPININTATQAELESLPGIGPLTAQKIIEFREQNGPFKTIEEIMNVPGIGQKTFEEIKALITV